MWTSSPKSGELKDVENLLGASKSTRKAQGISKRKGKDSEKKTEGLKSTSDR